MDLGKINAAVCLEMQDALCQNARIAIGGVAPTTIRLQDCEYLLRGNEITEDILREIEEQTPEAITPIDDVRSTVEYRKNMK